MSVKKIKYELTGRDKDGKNITWTIEGPEYLVRRAFKKWVNDFAQYEILKIKFEKL